MQSLNGSWFYPSLYERVRPVKIWKTSAKIALGVSKHRTRIELPSTTTHRIVLLDHMAAVLGMRARPSQEALEELLKWTELEEKESQ